MNFLTKSELAAYPGSALGKLADYGEIAITDDGKVRRVKAMKSLNDIWAKTKNMPPMTDEEIESEIQAARAETKAA